MGAPDLVVHYHASVNQRIDINGVDREFGYCERGECQPFVYESGTIVLDLVDARTNTLVWRGWAQDAVGDMLEDRDTMDRKINEAVTRILARLPGTL